MNSNQWKNYKLDEIAEIIGGGTPSTTIPDFWGEEIPWVTPRDLASTDERFISRGERCITKKGLQNSSARLLPAGTVLLTTRAPIGYLRIALNPICTNQGFKSLIPKTDIADNQFLFYLLKNNVEYLKSIGVGTTFAEISGSALRQIEFPIPPLSIQNRIADILSALDDKIELNRQTNATMEAIAQAIFKEWFVENEKAYEWDFAPLPEVIEINPPRSLKVNQIAPYLDMASMPTTGHRVNGWVNRPFGSGTKFINGDTLIAKITPCLENGKTAYVDFLDNGQIGWGSTEYIIFRPRPPIPPEYGYFLARSDEIRNYAIQNMIGTSGRQRVPVTCFNFLSIRIPPTDLVFQFGIIAESLMKQIRANSEESKTLAFIRDALLPKLISGEIDL